MSYGREVATEMEIEEGLIMAGAEHLAGNGMWVTRDGSEIYVRDMTDSHIENCIRMLERGHSPYADVFISMFEAEQERRRST